MCNRNPNIGIVGNFLDGCGQAASGFPLAAEFGFRLGIHLGAARQSPRDTSTNALAATTTPSAAGPLALAGSQSPHGPLSMPAASQAQPVAQSAVVPVEYQASAESSSVPAPVADAAGLGATGTLVAADQFHVIQTRLRQLGATYYLLESWGNQPQMYRFYCKMAVGGSAQYTRCFEATHADPLQSMEQVLRQVEAWRNGGSTKVENGE